MKKYPKFEKNVIIFIGDDYDFLESSNYNNKSSLGNYYLIEKDSRKILFEKFKKMEKYFDLNENDLFLFSDFDEFFDRKFIYHLKNCEIKEEIKIINEIIDENNFYRWDFSHKTNLIGGHWKEQYISIGWESVKNFGYLRNDIPRHIHMFTSNAFHLNSFGGIAEFLLKFLTTCHDNYLIGGLCTFENTLFRNSSIFDCIPRDWEPEWRKSDKIWYLKKDNHYQILPLLLKNNKERFKHLINLDWK